MADLIGPVHSRLRRQLYADIGSNVIWTLLPPAPTPMAVGPIEPDRLADSEARSTNMLVEIRLLGFCNRLGGFSDPVVCLSHGVTEGRNLRCCSFQWLVRWLSNESDRSQYLSTQHGHVGN